MADEQLPQTILDFRKLSKDIAEMKAVLESVRTGKMADLAGKPEEIFGDIPADIQVDAELMKRFADERIDKVSETCIDTFDAAVKAEVAVAALFAATRQHAEETQQVFINNDRDREQAEQRLSRLTIATDDYQDEPWEDENAANTLRTAAEPALVADYLEKLRQGRHQYTMRSEALEAATAASLKAGLARIDAAQTMMASELLRIRTNVDAAQTVIDNPDHEAALKNIARNVEWAESLLKNADEAQPHLRRRWGFETENGNGGTTPPRNRMN